MSWSYQAGKHSGEPVNLLTVVFCRSPALYCSTPEEPERWALCLLHSPYAEGPLAWESVRVRLAARASLTLQVHLESKGTEEEEQ